MPPPRKQARNEDPSSWDISEDIIDNNTGRYF